MTLVPATDLGLPERAAGDPLAHVVAALLRKRRGPPAEGAATHAHWDAAFFGLDRVTLFAAATPGQRDAILERCGRELLAEAFYIEKAGVAFAAKMILLSESSDERKLYALFAADEAAHLDGVARFYQARVERPAANPFLTLLAQLIDEGDRASLQLIIQVVLEGWGLSHYRSLRDGCRSEHLRALLSSILADEAAHHGSGVLLVAEQTPDAASRELSLDAMRRFLALVQAGPRALVAAIEATCGPLASAARRQLWTELDAERHSATRLAQLHQLLGKAPTHAHLTARLERAGCFLPLSFAETT